MSLMKWFRRNNKKVMAVVVIVIMFGFVGGSWLTQLAKKRGNPTVAHYLDGRKILNSEINASQRELELLRSLRADDLLQSQDLFGLFLRELLFGESRSGAQMVNTLKRVARENQYRISESDIYSIYQRSAPGSVYWLLLKAEAHEAGTAIPTEDAGKLLGRIVPQIMPGASYSQFMQALMSRYQMPEDAILRVFAQMLSVLQYAQTSCSLQDVTAAQVAHASAEMRENLDVELAEIRAEFFIKEMPEPTAESIAAQFAKFKDTLPTIVSADNPHGFGYMIPDAVQLEYIAVKLDDVSAVITAPTQQDKEDYYQQHINEFTEATPVDPNDPNSTTINEVRDFTDVESIIDSRLRQSRTDALASDIISTAAELTEADLLDIDQEDMTSAILKDKAGDYSEAAKQLFEKFAVEVATGKTGVLNARTFQEDEYLRRLYVKGNQGSPVPLSRSAFIVEELTGDAAGAPDIAKPKLYENLGPVRDMLGEIIGMVRIIDAKKAHSPASSDVEFAVNGIKIGPDDPNDPNASDLTVFSVNDTVVEDLKKLAAMDLAKTRGEEFKAIAAKDGFETAIDKFNELYGEQAKESPDDPNAFRLQTLSQLQRISSSFLETNALQNEGNPAAEFVARQRAVERLFIDRLYSMIPADSNSLADTPVLVIFEPDLSYYCIKQMSVQKLWKEDFNRGKSMEIYRLDHVSTQSLAPVHFNPDNIIARTNFAWTKTDADKEEADADDPNETEEPTG